MPYEGRSARVDLSDIVGLRVPADHDEALIICYETMSCCGRKRKQAAKGAQPTLASPAAVLMRRAGEPPVTDQKPVTPSVTRR